MIRSDLVHSNFSLISCQLPFLFAGLIDCCKPDKCVQTVGANRQKSKKHLHTHLLGDGGVWRDMVGTPVVGVI